MPTHAEQILDEEQWTRIVVFFDGQNVLRTAGEVFGFDRNKLWNYDPRKLVEATVASMETQLRALNAPHPRIAIEEIRFYTGVPTYERDRYVRSYWDRVFNRFRNDGIVVVTRDLRYYKQGPPREKGIDLRIGLDIGRIAATRRCDGILLFSQDTDLAEAIQEARDLQARYTGQGRIYYFCAFPRNADPATHHGISRMHWIPLYAEEFEAAAYAEPPKVDIFKLIESLERRHRKKALHDFDLIGQGKRVTGCFRGCHRIDEKKAALILEARADLLIMNVHPECAELFGKFKDIDVSVVAQSGHKGLLEVEVRPLAP